MSFSSGGTGPPRTLVSRILHATAWFGSMYCVGALFGHSVATWTTSFGPSMYPTLPAEPSVNIFSRYYRRGRDLKVGDIISCQSPHFQRRPIGKRIIGMPGDYVLRDPAQAPTAGGASRPPIVPENEEREEPVMIQVPEGHVWLAGDNMAWSRDSRFHGPVPLALIIGKTLYCGDGWFSWTSFRDEQLRPVGEVEEEEAMAPASTTISAEAASNVDGG